MKIALVHDRIFPGGALKVFEDLIAEEKKNFLEADFCIFTMLAEDSREKTLDSRKKGKELMGIEIVEALPRRISRIFTACSRKKIPIFSSLFDYRNLIVFYPWIMKVLSRKMRRFGPERVVISSFAIGKNVGVDFHPGGKLDVG